MVTLRATIALLGGAMTPAEGEFQLGIEEAGKVGINILAAGGKAIDSVLATVSACEDNPVLNCGLGARLNLFGEAELDACIMDGVSLRSGAVAAIRNVKHPIQVAFKVIEETDYMLFVDRGAESFARAVGFPEEDVVTPERRKEWEDIVGKIKRGERLPDAYQNILSYWNKLHRWIDDDTIGVVAMDSQGNIAAGTSSGGGPLKMPGRVGDVPLVGCGIYADNEAGAAVFTGHGEVFNRYLAAKQVCDYMREGATAQEAADRIVSFLQEKVPVVAVSLLTLDTKGNVGGARNVSTSPHAYFVEGAIKPVRNFSKIHLKAG